MIRLITVAALAALLAGPAMAQKTPANNGLNGLNARGTIGDAPDFGATPPPQDCTAGDSRAECQQAAVPSEATRSYAPSVDPYGRQGMGDSQNQGDIQSQGENQGPALTPRPSSGPTSGN